jgi:Skp family chaperone for outer membrane proteins
MYFGVTMQFRNLAFFAAAVCVVSIQAQEAPRFAFFDYRYLVENTAQGKRVFAEAQTLSKRLEDQLKVKFEELQRMEQQLRSSSLSEDGRNKISREFEDGKVAYQRMQEDSQAQYQRVLATASQQFETEIGPIIEVLAKERKLHCVFQLQNGLVAWADKDWVVSFTEEVGKRYDAAFPGGVAANKAPATSEAASKTATKK